jgi:predicted ribosome quality control (RQC) complex YloA/Tae2 family protein
MILMKNNILLFLFMFFSASTLSAQSKKELNLRIDTLQTELNSENLKAQNLTLQIQNLTTELEKMNKGILLLTSQVVKQDSMKNNLKKQIHILFENIESIKRVNDSIVKVKEKNKNQYIQDSIQMTKEVTYCFKNSSDEQVNNVTYTSIIEITITIKNGIVKGNYSNIIQRNGNFMQGDNDDLTGKVVNNEIQGLVVSSHTEQAVNWKKTGSKNIKFIIGETITWNGHDLKKCLK